MTPRSVPATGRGVVFRTCTCCGETKQEDQFHWKSRVRGIRGSACAACATERARQYRRQPGYKSIVRAYRARPEVKRRVLRNHAQDPTKRMLIVARYRAKKLGVPFDITSEDLVVPSVCPVLGIPIETGEGRASPNSPSVDRIVPERGYVRDNVRVISTRANALKSDGTPDELEAVARYAREALHESQNPSTSRP